MTTDELDRQRLLRSVEKQNYTVRDLMELAGVTERVALSWINTKQLRAWTAGLEPGRKKPRWRVRREDWEAFVAGRTSVRPAKPVRRSKAQPAGSVPDFNLG